MTRALLLSAVSIAVLLPARAGPEPDPLITAGAVWWRSSGDARSPVACATCHHDPVESRGWAASFPKFKPLPPPHGRVMTLLQANAEAVRTHYRLADPLPAATALTAYLTAHGAGLPLTPGRALGQPAFPTRLRALAESVARGRRLYASQCADCHSARAIAPAVADFPRARGGRAESLEAFLEHHVRPGTALAWASPAMADVVAYLTAERARPNPARPESR
jgi:mono/diheme cytochrome c family protein